MRNVGCPADLRQIIYCCACFGLGKQGAANLQFSVAVPACAVPACAVPAYSYCRDRLHAVCR